MLTFDHTRRAMSNCPSHHRMSDRGKSARATMFPSIDPSTIRIPPSRGFFQKEHSGDACFNHQPLHCRLQRGWDHNQHQRDQRPIQPQPPSPSPDHGFKSDRSLVSTASLVSSQSDKLEDSQHSQHGRRCRETGAHMKINLPIFKDEDTKDAVSYQSWRWDLTVYCRAGC